MSEQNICKKHPVPNKDLDPPPPQETKFPGAKVTHYENTAGSQCMGLHSSGW